MKNFFVLLLSVVSLLFVSCSTTMSSKNHSSVYCSLCARDDNGRIQRNVKAKKDFMRQTGYPDGHPGYVVDHIIPLYKGGKDTPENMQWMTIEEHREKHRDL